MPRIPNLTMDLYRVGSRNTAPVPTLTRSNIQENGKFDFEWEAEGTQNYEVTASGKLSMSDNAYRRWKGMHVHCTCMSYEEMDLRTTKSGWRVLYVCKHLKAALDSVCDVPENETSEEEDGDGDGEEEEEEESESEDEEEDDDDDDGAGQDLAKERERLENELLARSDRQIVVALRQRMSTDEGLKALSVLFPPKQEYGRKRSRSE